MEIHLCAAHVGYWKIQCVPSKMRLAFLACTVIHTVQDLGFLLVMIQRYHTQVYLKRHTEQSLQVIHFRIYQIWLMKSRFSKTTEAGGSQQQERTDPSAVSNVNFPLLHLLDRTFHSCLILILKLMLITDHHERVGDSQLKQKGHKHMKMYPHECSPHFFAHPFSGTET